MSIFLAGFTALLWIVTLVPLLPIAHGLVRLCDFPRIQIAVLAAVLVPLTIWAGGLDGWTLATVAAQILIIVVQGVQCARFTPLWRIQSLVYEGSADDPCVLRIIAANVKMSNRQYDRLLRVVQRRDPHIVIFMEIDDAWLAALQPLRTRLPNVIECPQDNAYGMALFSRLPLSNSAIRFLVIDKVPSIRTEVTLADGQVFSLYALHPEPPVPYEDTLGRDGEIILASKEMVKDPLPAIVTGDLNDVAWSRTTRRFQRLAGVLDPRVGRGFFNSFDARFWFLRWPLDHLFHDPRFRLICIERLPFVGSDHFPMLFDMALTQRPAADLVPDRPGAADQEEVRDVLRQAAEIDREPIGANWEK